MHASSVLLAALVSTAQATVYTGFNYGSTGADGGPRVTSDFQAQFSTAQKLEGAPGFNSARLYTMIQGGTAADPISAIQAAIDSKTTLLLGMWASAGDEIFTNEILALNAAIKKYGSKFTDLVVGLSIGSEDLYRASPMGIAAKSGVGAEPDTLVKYIGQVRTALADTALDTVPLGHVDTWTAFVNNTNAEVISALDWIGMDAYPYFQSTMYNDVSVSADLFFEALGNCTSAAQGKAVWITETGWPTSGKTQGQGVASISNAKTYWDLVACRILGKYNTWWYTLDDSPAVPAFGLVGSTLSTTPLYDLSCKNVVIPSSSSATPSKTATGANGASTGVSSASTHASQGTGSATRSGGATGTAAAASGGASGTGASSPAQSTPGAASNNKPALIAAAAVGLLVVAAL